VACYGSVTIGDVWRQLKGWRAKAVFIATSPLALALWVQHWLKFPSE
jgi:hypothetical protein